MVDGLGIGGYHWLSRERVAQWDARRKSLADDRREGFDRMLAALPLDRSKVLRIVDLGAGDGTVAAIVLDQYPRSRAVLVDFSAAMMEKGIRELDRFAGRFRYICWDMNVGDWPDSLGGHYDAVVSSAAIHHLVNPRKRWLAMEVIRHLSPGGVFANYDLHRDGAAQFGDDEEHDRTCATVDEAAGFLREVGYVDVAIAARSPRPKHKGELALVLGRRAAR